MQGASGKRAGRRRLRHLHRAGARRPDLYPHHGQRLRHRAGAAAHRLPAPRHQQAAPPGGSGRHRHAGLPGRGAGRHRRRVPGGHLLPADRRGLRRYAPSGGRRAGGCHRGGLSRRHHRLHPRPVLQHPRPDEVHEEGHRRGRCRRRCGDPSGAESSRRILQAAAGWAGDPAHPRRRPAAVRHLRGAGPGLCQQPAARERQRRRGAGGGLYHQAAGRSRHPRPPAVLRQRPVRQEPASGRRRGGGLPQPAAEGPVPRLRPPHYAAGERGGCQRPPRQDRGEIPVRQGRV